MSRRLSFGLVGLGLGLVAWGAWIPTKAWVGQRLLARAWDESRAVGQPQRPWAWADIAPVARLRFEDGDALIVVSGASGQSLAWGPGHVDGTARPGEAGNAVVAGHRDTHFERLAGIEVGALVHAESLSGQARSYRVASTHVVPDHALGWLAQDFEGLTLVTCYPFGGPPGGRQRFVVRADRVDLPDSS